MTLTELVSQLLQVPNTLTVLGIAVAVLTAVAAWWFYHAPRRIQIVAQASSPILWLDPGKLPFVVKVTNTNTRQVKIRKVGFEVVGKKVAGKKSHLYELTLDSNMLKTEQLLIPEADETEVQFDGYKIADDIRTGLQGFNLPVDVTAFRVWLYITHGRRVAVAVAPNLAATVIARIHVGDRV
jgi:hypothetical protein